MKIEEKIAKIIEQSHPGCGLSKECNTECGKCGAERLKALLPPDIDELMEKLKCPDCGKTKSFQSAKEVIDYLHSDCPTCKGTGLDPNRELVVVDRKAKCPEVRKDFPFIRLEEQSIMLKDDWVKEVCE